MHVPTTILSAESVDLLEARHEIVATIVDLTQELLDVTTLAGAAITEVVRGYHTVLDEQQFRTMSARFQRITSMITVGIKNLSDIVGEVMDNLGEIDHYDPPIASDYRDLTASTQGMREAIAAARASIIHVHM